MGTKGLTVGLTKEIGDSAGKKIERDQLDENGRNENEEMWLPHCATAARKAANRAGEAYCAREQIRRERSRQTLTNCVAKIVSNEVVLEWNVHGLFERHP